MGTNRRRPEMYAARKTADEAEAKSMPWVVEVWRKGDDKPVYISGVTRRDMALGEWRLLLSTVSGPKWITVTHRGKVVADSRNLRPKPPPDWARR